MAKRRGRRRWARLLVVCGLLGSLLIPVSAAEPITPGRLPGATNPLLPDHRAEEEAFNSIRQAPPGLARARARLDALRQAQTLPTTRTLPGAIGGKGLRVGENGLAPPSAIWQQLGPAPENSDTNPDGHIAGHASGRATAIVVGQHTGVIYLGTAGGGVWKSADDGASWTPLTDTQQSLAIGALALDPTDTQDKTLYAGTGEPNFSQDAYQGVGVLKTTDGGATWALQGAGFPGFGIYSASSASVHALVANGATVFAATSVGFYRSTDGGANWTQITVASGFPTARATDIAVDGANVYVVLSVPAASAAYTGVYKSTTGGTAASFTPITTGLPATGAWHRAQIALAPSAPQTLYLSISNSNDYLLGIYKTTNGGTLWGATTTQPTDYFGGQGWYDQTIAVDPANENDVYAGGVHVVSSSDGGVTWVRSADVYCCHVQPIHPDQHAFAFGISGTPRPLYVANDGGIWKTTNGTQGTGTIWTDLNGNLATSEFYAGDAAANYASTSIVVGGLQDNGTPRSTSASLGLWNSILGGDGMFVAVSKADPNIVYAEYYNGYLQKTTNANAGSAVSWTNVAPYSHGCSISYVLFVTPFVMDPNDSSHLLYAARDAVCETINGGATWTTSPVQSGFYTRTAAIAPTNSATLYAAVRGTAYRATNGHTGSAATFSACGTGLPPDPSPLTWITADPTNATTAYVTEGGFGIGHVWKTTNCGTWTNITGNLPDVPATSIVAYASTPNPTLVVSTDIGVFLSTNNGTSWSALQNGLPNVPVDEVFTDIAHTTLFAATHGRGMWKMPIPADTLAAPTVTAIAPPFGSPNGGTNVTITGTNFSAGATVFFDGIAATNVVVVNSTTITATTPAHPAAVVTVTVVNTDNQGGTLNQGFTYGVLIPLPPPQPSVAPIPTPRPLPSPRPTSAPTLNTPLPLPTRRP
ncbi:MAG: IPT/TIG domain-containing protein [Thermomicrobiales bacterium]